MHENRAAIEGVLAVSKRRAFGGLRKLPSKRWQAYYTGPDGRRHLGWTTYLARGDGESWLRDEELLIDQHRWTPPAQRSPVAVVSPMTLDEYAAGALKRRQTRARKPLRRTTADLYERLMRLAISPQLGHVPLVEITPARVVRWFDSLPAKNRTQNGNAYLLLKSLMIEAEADGLIDQQPCRIKGAGKPAPKRQGISLNVGQLGVYTAAGDRHALPLLLAAWCALRSGEVRALRTSDVSEDGSWLRVEQTVARVSRNEGGGREWHFGPPKTDAGRRAVAVPPHLAPMLAAWLAERKAGTRGKSAILFPAGDGVSPLSEDVLRTAHKRAAAAAGVPEMTVHDLRRTGATLAGQTGATIKELMRMLGHTTPGVAMIYQTADDARAMELARKMGELAG